MMIPEVMNASVPHGIDDARLAQRPVASGAMPPRAFRGVGLGER